MMQKTVHVCEWCGKERTTADRYETPYGWLSIGLNVWGIATPEQPTRRGEQNWQPLQEPGWNIEELPTSAVFCSTGCARNYLVEVDKFLERYPERLARLRNQAGPTHVGFALPAPPPIPPDEE